MNKSLALLFEEHGIIEQAAETVKRIAVLAGTGKRYQHAASVLIGFFREYGDRYHHYKEEHILFPEMARKNELLEGGVIGEMIGHHEDFRDRLSLIEVHLKANRQDLAQKELESYIERLMDHIAVENEEVFPMAETLLNETELEMVGFRFADCDRELGNERKNELAALPKLTQKEILYGTGKGE